MIQTKTLHIHESGSVQVNAQKYDPTHTTTLRNAFSREMGKRFRALRGVIRKAIVDDDVFDLKRNRVPTLQQGMSSPGEKAFDFPRSQDKVTEFMGWLDDQVQKGILEVGEMDQVGTAAEKAWTNKFITDSYQRGVQRGRYELSNAGYEVSSIENSGGIDAVMNQPVHMDTVGLLYTRTFNELKGITDAMGQQISRVLSEGIAEGDNPSLLARKLNSVIKGGGADLGITDTLGRYIPAERRARILARTEVIRAHHMATMQEYKNWKAEGVNVKAEFQTAGDNRVCPRCLSWQSGGPYSLEKIQNLIPLHPQCRCVALPTKPTMSKKKPAQKAQPKPKSKPKAQPKTTPSEPGTKYWTDIDKKLWENRADNFSDIQKRFDEIGVHISVDDSFNTNTFLDKMNFAGRSMSDLQERFPKVREYLNNVRGDLQLKLQNSKFIDNAGGLGGYTPNKNLITIGTKASGKKVSKLQFNKWIVGDDYYSAMRHEIGHRIHMSMNGIPHELKVKFNKAYKSMTHAQAKKAVSEYGASNKFEFFAEAFSAYTSPKYQKGMLPRKLEEIMEEILEK